MNTENKEPLKEESKYGKGFAMRFTILIALLGLVGAGLYYDRVVLPGVSQKTIDKAMALIDQPDRDGHGITQEEVHKAIGMQPSETFEAEDGYLVETYRFRRFLPIAKGNYINVVYQNGALRHVIQDKEFSKEEVEKNQVKLGYRSADPEKFKGMPVQLGGVPAASTNDDDDDEDDEDEDDEDDEDDEESNDEDNMPLEKRDAERTRNAGGN